MAQNSTRQTLMKRVQMYEFALVEANLFLDSHPDDQEALKYYSKYAGLLQEAKAAYEKQFGSLTPGCRRRRDRWSWVDDPWPWDLQANTGEEA